FGLCRALPDQLAEVVHRVVLAAVAVGRFARVAIGIDQVFAGDAADTTDRRDRHREGGLVDAGEDGLVDCHRVRQTQGEADALARGGANVERTAELADLAGDHVHADAATGRPADRIGGGEARLEDQRVQVGVAEYRVRTHQPALLAAATDRLAVEATAIVGHFEHDFRTFATDRDADAAFLGLASALALVGQLDAVRDGVAQHVLQRRGHALKHVAVQL